MASARRKVSKRERLSVLGNTCNSATGVCDAKQATTRLIRASRLAISVASSWSTRSIASTAR